MEASDQSLISDYLANQLNAEERQQVEERLSSDPDFKSLFQQQAGDIYILHALERSKLKAKLKQDFQFKNPTRARIRPFVLAAAILSVAASLLLLVWFVPGPAKTAEQMAMAYLEPYPVDDIRGEKSANQEGKEAAYQAYRQQDFTLALEHFEALQLTDPDNTQITLYRGECLAQLGHYAEAARLYKGLAQSSVYHDAAQWRLALNLLLAGEQEAAREELKRIESSDHYKQTEAKKLLEALP